MYLITNNHIVILNLVLTISSIILVIMYKSQVSCTQQHTNYVQIGRHLSLKRYEPMNNVQKQKTLSTKAEQPELLMLCFFMIITGTLKNSIK